MVRFSSNIGGEPLSETGNWNIASDYASLKIMKLLYLADEYELIAKFGAINFFEELQLSTNKDYFRVKAIERLIHILIMLINNTYFAVIYPADKQTLKDKKGELGRMLGLIGHTFIQARNEVQKQTFIRIDEEKFMKLLYAIVQVKSEINEPLNKSHLIFISREVYDPREQKKRIIDEAIKRG